MSERKMCVEYVRESDGAIVSVWVLEAEVKVFDFGLQEMGVESKDCQVETLLERSGPYGPIPSKDACERCHMTVPENDTSSICNACIAELDSADRDQAGSPL